MSSSTRSTARWPSDASASRPFSANDTLWPSCSSARPRSRRFTRLSSTTRMVPDSESRREVMSKLSEPPGDEFVLSHEALDAVSDAVEGARAGQTFEVSRDGGQTRRAQRLTRGLQRMGSSAEGVHVAPAERGSERGDQLS